jgi:hypothetical protein
MTPIETIVLAAALVAVVVAVANIARILLNPDDENNS